MQLHNEWVIKHAQNFSFCNDLLDLVLVNDVFFIDDFHSIQFASGAFPYYGSNVSELL